MSHAQVTYARLGPGDAAVLARVRPDTFDNALDPDQTSAFLADPLHEIVVARVEGEVVGFVSGTVVLHPDKAPQMFVNEVGVHDDFQRQGIATELMHRMLAIARARGCAYAWLGTEADNAPARGLYRKLGAREIEGLTHYEWDDP